MKAIIEVTSHKELGEFITLICKKESWIKIWIDNVSEILLIVEPRFVKYFEDVINDPTLLDGIKDISMNLDYVSYLEKIKDYKIKVFGYNSLKTILNYIGDEESGFIAKYFDTPIIGIFEHIRNKKIYRHINEELEEINDLNKFLFIGKEVKQFELGWDVVDSPKPYTIRNKVNKTLLEIIAPSSYKKLKKISSSKIKLFIINDSKIVTNEILKLILPADSIPFYLSYYENIPKEFDKRYNTLVLTSLGLLSTKDLNNINYKIAKWSNLNNNQIIILQGDEKSFSVFENLDYILIKIPHFVELQKDLTKIFIHFLHKYKRNSESGITEEFFSQTNGLNNLLKYFTSIEELDEAISSYDGNLNLGSIETWDLILKDVLVTHEDEKKSPALLVTTYKFTHQSKYWLIDLPEAMLPTEVKYNSFLGIKYLLYITESCNIKKKKVEQIVKEVDRWHAKKKNKKSPTTAKSTLTKRNPLAHRIEINFDLLKKRIPELKAIVDRITLGDYCYYEPDQIKKIKIEIFDEDFSKLFPKTP